jgi:parallel beta-helix repeat protein
MYQTWCRIIIVVMILGSIGVVSSSAIPFEMKYQGYIEVSGVPYTGVATTYFSLLDSGSSPTTNYWTNDNSQPSPGSRPVRGVVVSVSNGVFNLNLGDTTLQMWPIYSTVFINDPVYLRVWYKAGGNPIQQLTPDEQIVSAGYALNAARLGGLAVGHEIKNIPVNDYSLNSGLNADMLDNQHGSYYRNAGNLNAGVVPSGRIVGSYSGASVDYSNWAGNASSADNAISASSASNSNLLNGQSGSYYLDAGNLTGIVPSGRLVGQYDSATAGYALDAALLNGQDSSYYQNAGNLTGIVPAASIVGEYDSATVGFALNADKVDGMHATDFAKPLYDAIVAPTNGDYTTIQDALNAGKKTIFVKNGTYSPGWMAGRMNITQNGTVIIGESRSGVKIISNDFMMGGGFYADGGSGVYSSGSCHIDNYGNTVSGYGVSWTSDMIGRFIQLGTEWYEIAGYSDSSTLTLKANYYGFSSTFTSYQITSFLSDIRIENLSIMTTGEFEGGLQFSYVKNATIRNCSFSRGMMETIRFWNCVDCLFENNIIEDCWDYALELYQCDHFVLRGNDIHQNEGYALELYNSNNNSIIENNFSSNYGGLFLYTCSNNQILNNKCMQNSYSGIALYQYASQNQIDHNICNANGEMGIYCYSTTQQNSITNNICSNNSKSGILMGNAATPNVDNMIIANNRCENNGQYGIECCGNDNAISDNICNSNGFHGIHINYGTGNRLESNVCNSNSTDGIKLEASSYNSLTNCRGKSNAGYGINISDAGCIYNTVLGCHITNNAGSNYHDAGTNTRQAYNYLIED